ncbi:rRNA maturation RNase YbeY [Mucilaginibacter gossypiicola]|uniref:Endoribonuclease YbeY n=2 Tax=Mucilaginibacter TaxID=423349 RepID=A0AAE6JJ95_9SPHI|nr:MULTISPECIES: rRNA maturation RNase YbeY [Mucilaginibacter]QEM06822.1 rRNA maturation RNase YbeY [Mucilaginibacter rubeus]QEM19411.1 rRNA maturation RNase YbeY [Mucilaginibacter gossypii]QTE44041.1 rRNA maturation RNase YbeY [Mucilaginibacter rubeus]QTE50642.1 rRNA maturation RNase YbeY [Mucilaginibacter rubeus]QTE55726.1 rRNA maturation RNase YbeY [Mucilaginibacter rubeus]
MPAINFFEEDTTFKPKQKAQLRQWIKETVIAEGFKLKELNYIFCSDAYLLQINQQYLDHDTFTDIVTFDNSEVEGDIVGDIFISIDRIRENGDKFKTGETNELHRVIIHGALHLLGYTDKSVVTKQKMTQKEDEYLAKRNF